MYRVSIKFCPRISKVIYHIWRKLQRKKEKGKNSLFVALRLNCSYKTKTEIMKLYYPKTKFYLTETKIRILSFLSITAHSYHSYSTIPHGGVEIERGKSVKLIGIIVTDKVTWNENTIYICSKASKRLYHLKQLRRVGLYSVDLLAFYGSVIRPVLEYACPVWHTSGMFKTSPKENFISEGEFVQEILHCHQVRITQITSSITPTEVHSILPP